MVVCLRREAVVVWGFVLPETVDGLPDFVDGEGAFFQLPPLGVVEDPREAVDFGLGVWVQCVLGGGVLPEEAVLGGLECMGVTYLSHPHLCLFRVSQRRCAPYANRRAAARVLSCHGILPLPFSVGLILLRWCGMLPTYASYVFSPLLFLTVLCLLWRILACVVWRRFISYLHSTRLHTPLWPPLFVVLPACAA